MVKIIEEGEMLPRGYGLAFWRDEEFYRRIPPTGVCYPVPLHLVVRYARLFYIKLRWVYWRHAHACPTCGRTPKPFG